VPPTQPAADRTADHRLRRLAANASISLAVSLALMKLVGSIFTGSLALLTSLIDSVADIMASLITFFAVRVSTLPPDERHRFGHGKAESLSALAQAGIVTGSAFFVVIEAVRRLWQPTEVVRTGLGLSIMAIAIVGTIALVILQKHVVARTGSQAIAADSLHYQGDLAINLSVVLSLWLAGRPGAGWVDPVFALMIAGYLLWHARQIAGAAIRTLMDHELSQAERDRIKSIVRAHPEIVDLHDLRTREAGPTVFIEFHVELDGAMSVADAHDVIDIIEAELLRVYPGAEIIVHQEPAGISDARLDDVVHRRPDP